MRPWVFFRESMKAKSLFCPHDEERYGKSIRIHHDIGNHCHRLHAGKGVAHFWVSRCGDSGYLDN